ncbi:MAG: sodium:alanine symporter family protein [Ruminococcaceae bacterium]|nr:sodium:alanine symporter family protein [Oscillospiraceae bacterium]
MFYQINSAISAFVWGPPMLAVFLGTGLFLSVKSGFYQIFGVKDWFGGTVVSAFKNRNKQKSSDGSISQLGALTSALAACLGTGNIVGVATAICSGGAGAVFWMCISAVLGMITCCCENILGVKYRVRDSFGKWAGGPMYYIERGLGMKGLAGAYAVFLTGASLGMGNMTQANSVAQGLSGFGVKNLWAGIILAGLVAVSISGGLKRISAISEKLIPVLSVAFVAACFIIIGKNIENLIPCIKSVLKEAFTIRAVSGFGMAKAARYGISRGVFSNEAGLGSSAIIHAAADCKNPAEQGKWGILEVFIDTVFMCTVTAAAILTSGVWSPDTSINGVELCSAVFESVFGKAGGYFLNGCICLFAFATLVAWSYYGKSGAEYLFGEKSGKIYNLLYIAAAFAGSMIRLESVWSISDTLNGLMAVPNIFALLLLSKEAVGLLKKKPGCLQSGGVSQR